MGSSHEITELLLAWKQGDQSALERLMPLVEKELRRLAKSYMRKEKQGHTLQTTALVNEAFLRLVDQNQAHWKNRAQFFGIAATCMRRVLLDYARAQGRDKRGGGLEHIAISKAPPIPVEVPVDLLNLLALDEALQKLARLDARKVQVFELRYFIGCPVEEVAKILGVSIATVGRDWSFTLAWLRDQLGAKPKAVRTD